MQLSNAVYIKREDPITSDCEYNVTTRCGIESPQNFDIICEINIHAVEKDECVEDCIRKEPSMKIRFDYAHGFLCIDIIYRCDSDWMCAILELAKMTNLEFDEEDFEYGCGVVLTPDRILALINAMRYGGNTDAVKDEVMLAIQVIQHALNIDDEHVILSRIS